MHMPLFDQPPAPPSFMRRADGAHTLEITTEYGDVVHAEHVGADALGDALHRFNNLAVTETNCVVVLDGIMHTRNAFLEFVRHFRDWQSRQPAH